MSTVCRQASRMPTGMPYSMPPASRMPRRPHSPPPDGDAPTGCPPLTIYSLTICGHHRIGGIYVNTGHSEKTAIRKAVELVRHAGQEPSDLRVSFRFYGLPENMPDGMARRIWRHCLDEPDAAWY